jgi:hypothetical protein
LPYACHRESIHTPQSKPECCVNVASRCWFLVCRFVQQALRTNRLKQACCDAHRCFRFQSGLVAFRELLTAPEAASPLCGFIMLCFCLVCCGTSSSPREVFESPMTSGSTIALHRAQHPLRNTYAREELVRTIRFQAALASRNFGFEIPLQWRGVFFSDRVLWSKSSHRRVDFSRLVSICLFLGSLFVSVASIVGSMAERSNLSPCRHVARMLDASPVLPWPCESLIGAGAVGSGALGKHLAIPLVRQGSLERCLKLCCGLPFLLSDLRAGSHGAMASHPGLTFRSMQAQRCTCEHHATISGMYVHNGDRNAPSCEHGGFSIHHRTHFPDRSYCKQFASHMLDYPFSEARTCGGYSACQHRVTTCPVLNNSVAHT